MNNSAAEKLQMMKRSIHCLRFGQLALLPVIGLPFAFAALWLSGQIRLLERNHWNAAKPYRIVGVACAIFGTAAWIMIAGLIVTVALSNQNR